MKMLADIRAYGFRDQKVLKAMAAVPRHEFVPADQVRRAYDDMPLPIGHGQTISQPYIVAEMTRLLNVKPGDKVLEVGAGSGYQAAVLAELTPHVFGVEIVEPLADQARARLERLGYDTVRIRRGDGYYGWPEEAPFNGILVAAAAPNAPRPLLDQLAPKGRMVIPIGPAGGTQDLMLFEKDAEGCVAETFVMAVRFVPFTRRRAKDET